MPEWSIFVLVAGLLVTHGVAFVLWALDATDFISTPADIYYSIEVNWFGAIALYVLYMVFCPLWWLICFVAFLFTVGRK